MVRADYFIMNAGFFTECRAIIASKRWKGGSFWLWHQIRELPCRCVARLNANGTLDNTFGGTGIMIFEHKPDEYWDYFTDIAIQPDGKILASGISRSVMMNYDFAVARI